MNKTEIIPVVFITQMLQFGPLGNFLDLHKCCTDLAPGDFIQVFGDTHVYRTHVRPLQEQLQKLPKPFPVRILLNRNYAV